ncbi:MAG: dephospho-CoA kinase [Desulfobacterales bacterium]|nr:dephospho-CoA kinase [Desulfobacterales bacterium]
MKNTIGRHSGLILGVTGGIASGKNVVSGMLGAMGAKTIDFDILAREVVGPKKLAWKDIVDYFGEQILSEDNTVDRKKLSDIVFKNVKKLRKLESFTHPRIGDEFVKRIKKITTKNSKAIIQVVVPLLIEEDMQGLFDKLLGVYVPKELQIERLMARDKISTNQAVKILSSQLPMAEKVKFADFVIHNDRSLDKTREQVEELWEVLQKMQKEKMAK